MPSIAKKLFKYCFLFILAVYCLVWLLSPTVFNYYLKEYVQDHKLVLSGDTSIRYNPFLAHITINDLSLTELSSESKEAVFSIKQLDFELRLHQIIFDNVHISEFIIDGLFIKSEIDNDQIKVAGVILPQGEQVDETVEQSTEVSTGTSTEFGTEQSDTDSSAEPIPYIVYLPRLVLTDASFDVEFDGEPHVLKLHQFTLEDMQAGVVEQALELAISSEFNQSAIDADITLALNNSVGKIGVALDAKEINLAKFKQFLPKDVTQFEGKLSYQANHQIELDGENIRIAIEELSLKASEIVAEQNSIITSLGEKTLTSELLQLSVLPESEVIVEGTAVLALSNLDAHFESPENTLAKFDAFTISEINFAPTENADPIGISLVDINLENAIFSDNIENDIPALALFDLLNIDKIEVSPVGADIHNVRLSGVKVDAQLGEDKALLNLVKFAKDIEESGQEMPSENEEPVVTEPDEATVSKIEISETEPTDAKNSSAFAISLKSFALGDDAIIQFKDASVTPHYERNLTISTLSLGELDTNAADVATPFSIVGKSNEYAHLKFDGEIIPFAATPQYSLKGAFKEVSLPGISPYIKEALQYEIQSGQLDLGLDVKLDGVKLDGDADVLLRGIELTAADDHEADSLADKSSVPFNVALGMLKDGDGNVDLSLPLSGDTSNPSFGISGLMTLLIKQATMSAAKDYLMTTFVPYASVVNIAIAAGEYALQVSVNDLHYPATLTALQPDQQTFLSQFSALMKDEDDVQLKLCAVATAKDVNLAAGTKISDSETIEALKAISQKRVEIFKKHMVENEGIPSARLLLCTPQIDSSEEAQPRITFVL